MELCQNKGLSACCKLAELAAFIHGVGTLRIGREMNTLPINPADHAISRKHCELYYMNDVLMLRDFSSNGTIINGNLCSHLRRNLTTVVDSVGKKDHYPALCIRVLHSGYRCSQSVSDCSSILYEVRLDFLHQIYQGSTVCRERTLGKALTGKHYNTHPVRRTL